MLRTKDILDEKDPRVRAENTDVEFPLSLEYKNIINQLDKEQLEEEIKVPENLNSVLRYYQKTGFKWLKILDRYHFGGILADDMGLRKNYSNVISNS